MVKRSIRAGTAGIRKAKKEFNRRNLTQKNLAEEVNLKTRQPIWRFFSGRAIERQNFKEICAVLGLDWREIAEDAPEASLEPPKSSQGTVQNIDALVTKVRSQVQGKIQSQCGIIQLLDINHPIEIDDIYIDINVLDRIASSDWLELSDLQTQGPDAFDRIGMGNIAEKQIPGTQAVETYSKLRVLGKPGSGKTTFLQFLAIQSNRGEFAVQQIPIFIRLVDFADSVETLAKCNLFNYILEEFLNTDISSASILTMLLFEGKLLLLLDGLDEVPQHQSNTICREIRKFAEKYYKNLYIVSCRAALQHVQLKNFIDVEIAPFTKSQIANFAQKWFGTIAHSNTEDVLIQADTFLQKLKMPENRHFRKLTVTPLFLHLACRVFHSQEKFPTKRVEFYKQCLDLLLVKWDETKGIQREDIYQGFSLPQKLQILSQIAAATFEEGHFFFDQQAVEAQIDTYRTSLPGAITNPEVARLESEAVLKTIEAQHGLLVERSKGIFSFSYLLFQEYFTARRIVASHNLQGLDRVLERLVVHITEPRWREIFLLTASMLRSSDALVQLMKNQIDTLVAKDPYLQEFLTWASQKSSTLSDQPKISTDRAFYLALARSPHLSSHFALACLLDQNKLIDIALDNLVLTCVIDHSSDFAHAHSCADALNNALTMILDVSFYASLEQLQEAFPDPEQNREHFQAWWQSNYLKWAEQLRETISEHRNIGHHWNFSPEQQLTLERYYEANQLLMDCLNSNSEVTESVRQEIEETLFLPQTELEEREWQ